MKFVDEATLFVEAGKGGNGSRSFRREKYVPFGGPDGGDGGRGGDVFLVACGALNTLVDFRYIRKTKAGNGDCGHGKQCYGKSGEDKIIKVPVGTLVYDNETQELLGDLVSEGQTLIVAQGGKGGLGNIHFKTSTNRAPRHATPGQPGEARQLRLELKLLADVGLLGFPNAGKSTFIRAVSAARPKVADYPFTTLNPQLGTVRLSKGQSFVIADIPGIIEGANTGAGLGLRFLKHLTRTKLLLHCVDLADMQQTPIRAIELINKELEAYAATLQTKPRWLVLNKLDAVDGEEANAIKLEIEQIFGLPTYLVSSITQEGIKPLLEDAWEFLQTIGKVEETDSESLQPSLFEEVEAL